MRIPCPWCGPRALDEFEYGGDASKKRPAGKRQGDHDAWMDYVYYRDNPAGTHRCVHVPRGSLNVSGPVPAGVAPGSVTGERRCAGYVWARARDPFNHREEARSWSSGSIEARLAPGRQAAARRASMRRTRKVSHGEGCLLSANDQPFQERYIAAAV